LPLDFSIEIAGDEAGELFVLFAAAPRVVVGGEVEGVFDSNRAVKFCAKGELFDFGSDDGAVFFFEAENAAAFCVACSEEGGGVCEGGEVWDATEARGSDVFGVFEECFAGVRMAADDVELLVSLETGHDDHFLSEEGNFNGRGMGAAEGFAGPHSFTGFDIEGC